MLDICIQTSYDQNVQLILKSYLPVVYGIPLKIFGSKKTKVHIHDKGKIKIIYMSAHFDGLVQVLRMLNSG